MWCMMWTIVLSIYEKLVRLEWSARKTTHHLGTVVEALNPHGMFHTSTANICKVFEIIHIMWMGILTNHHAITTTFDDSDFGGWLKSWGTAGLQTIPWCISGWGSKPTWNGSRVHHHFWLFRFWRLDEILRYSLVTNNTLVHQWLRL